MFLDAGPCDSHLGKTTPQTDKVWHKKPSVLRGVAEKRGGMDDIPELERRISAALARIEAGLEHAKVAATTQEAETVARLADGVAEAEIARLNEALDEEKILSAQLQERLRAVKDRDAAGRDELQAENEKLRRQVDVQGLELQRLKKTVASLREELRTVTDAVAEGQIEPHLLNKAMVTELEALRALRSAEAAQIDDLISALEPLVPNTEVDANA